MASLTVHINLARLLLLVFVLMAGSAYAQDVANYQLGTGDSISIKVYQEEDLSIKARISDVGTISYPLLGTIKAAGLTVGQLEETITQGLKGDYLINPRVNVSIAEYRQFYVNGEVKSPGAFSFVPGLTVRKAISIAGGFAERADKKNIFILHEHASQEQSKRVTLDARVKPGDIITVEQSFF
jgi:polysaccharide export outer membrane protein